MSVSCRKGDQAARRLRNICGLGLASQVGVERIAKIMVLSHRFLGFIMKPVVNWGYKVFAKYRTVVTRGASLEDLVAAHKAKNGGTEDCDRCDNIRR